MKLIITEENVSFGKGLRVRFIVEDEHTRDHIGGFLLDHSSWWHIRNLLTASHLPWWKRLFFKSAIRIEIKLASEYIKERDSE